MSRFIDAVEMEAPGSLTIVFEHIISLPWRPRLSLMSR